MADIDDDGDDDVIYGQPDGTLRYSENITPVRGGAIEVEKAAAVDNPFDGLVVAPLPTSAYNHSARLVDLDGDGDLDLTVGADSFSLRYFENTGSATSPTYVEKTGTDNPFDGTNHEDTLADGDFADLDGDGDLDFLSGDGNGTLKYLENIGTSTAPDFVLLTDFPEPLKSYQGNGRTVPSFADIDGDGDRDLIITNAGGFAPADSVSYLENTGNAAAPTFVQRTGAQNPFDGISEPDVRGGAFADVDGDGDFDFLMGLRPGTFRYFENTGTPINPQFVERTGDANPFGGIVLGDVAKPEFADVNGDGRLDLVVASGDGDIDFFVNVNSGFYKLPVNVTPENDVPSITDLAGDTLAYSENDGPAVIDQGGDAAVTDPDSPDFNGGSLTATITVGGVNGEDVLAVGNVGQISVAGGVVSFNGDVIGTIAGGSNGNPLVVTFTTADTTPAAADALLRAITYENTSDNPDVTDRQISFSIDDGDGGTGIGSTATVTVGAVNDAPVITGLTGDAASYAEDDPATVIDQATAAQAVDVDSASFADGTLAVTITGGAVTTEDELFVRTAGDGPGEFSVSPGGALFFGGIEMGLVTGGVDGDPLLFTFGLNATPAMASALLANITYINTSPQNPTAGIRTISFRLTDGDGGTSAPVQATVAVTAVNDAPTITLPTTPTVMEDSSDNAVAGLSVGDVDDATLTVTLTATSTMSLAKIVGLDFGITGGAGDGTNDTTMTFSGTVGAINTALAGLTYTPTANDDDGGSITVIVNDGEATPVVDVLAVNITPVNDAPEATNLNQTKSYTEDGGPVSLDDIVVTDPDTGETITATLTLSDTAAGALTGGGGSYTPGTGVWSVTGGLADVNAALAAVSFVPAADFNGDFSIDTHVEDAVGAGPIDGVINFTGTPVNDAPIVDQGIGDQSVNEDTQWSFNVPADAFDDIDSTLILSATLADDSPLPSWLSFSGSALQFSGTPPLNFSGELDIKVTASDGEFSTSTAFKLTIDAVNDAPTLNLPLAPTVDEDSQDTPVPGILVGDVDGDELTVTLAATSTLSLGTSAGLTFAPGGGDGTEDETMTFSGSVAAINTALATLTYTPDPDANGVGSIAVTVDDGEAAAVTDTLTINITPVNDAPVIADGIDDQFVDEDTPWLFTVPATAFDDVEGDPLTFQVVPTIPGDDGLGLPSWLSFDDNTGTFSGTPPQDFDGFIDFDVFAVDGGFLRSDAVTFRLTVNPINDPPVITSDGGGETAVASLQENSTGVTTVVATDVDSTPTYVIAGGADQALFDIDATTGKLDFKTDPDFENPADDDGDNVYEVIVEATDGSLTDTQAISVTVNNEDGDTIKGTSGKDTLKGTNEEDTLKGKDGKDTLKGKDGNDLLDGGKGKDKLTGGDGEDAFLFSDKIGSSNVDTVKDFEVGTDRIHLDDKFFTKIGGTGDLKSKFFEKGKKADDSKDRIIYDKKSGDLFYDKDGKGGKDQVKIAELDKDLKLSEDDFLVV